MLLHWSDLEREYRTQVKETELKYTESDPERSERRENRANRMVKSGEGNDRGLLILAMVLEDHGQNKNVPQCSVESGSFGRVGCG